MKINSRFVVLFGLVGGVGLVGCGGRSVLDDERAYGDGRTAGIDGREILPLGSVTIDDGTNTVGPTTVKPTTGTTGPTIPTATGTSPTIPTGTSPTGTTTPGTTFPGTSPTVTMPIPTVTAVNPTTGMVAPTTTPTSTTTWEPTTTTGTATTTDTTALPVLVPFPPPGLEPSLPAGFEVVDWQDPYACYHNTYNGRFNCSMSYSCPNSANYGSAYCSLEGDLWYCECNDGQNYGSAQFDSGAVLEGEACRVAASMCISRWPEQTDSECTDSSDEGLDYCSYARYCNQALDSQGVTFKKTSQDYTNCSYTEVSGEEFVSCGCSNGSLGEFSMAWDPDKACLVAYDACTLGIDEGSQGEVECQWTSSSSELSYCTNTDRCTQEGTAGGIPVGIVSYRQTYCYLEQDDTWGCSCNYDGETRRYMAVSAREACDVAKVDCQPQ